MKIYFASDHAGFEMKNALVAYVRDELAYEIEDVGAREFDAEDDYPLMIAVAARMLVRDLKEGMQSRAIILGGSGQGEAIVANRFPEVRATVYYGGKPEIIKLSREHNDANVLSLGARFLSLDEAKAAVKEWLTTAFPKNDRHLRRIAEIETVVVTL
ncbi:RpiB/LacA/LacB family sugar-phosphate isomerase [Candidatus Kaiserbacteria bacterium]|nr:RpiB/LacA/LacB family sugar-phosphate isomerase [Candidatus Kaiserbacteria bacterium]